MNTILYFSPTGNTKYLAKTLQSQLQIDDSHFIELTDNTSLPQSDTLILMTSIQGFNHPRTVKRFIKKMSSNLYKNIHIISVGCSTSTVNSSAAKRTIKLLKRKHYNVVSNTVLAMPLTLIMSFPKNVIEESIDQSLSSLDSYPQNIQQVKPTTKSNILTAIGKVEDIAARLFGLELHAKKSCTSCGICWNRCPENNIKEKNGRPKFGIKCMMCLRCLYECPEQSITPYISKFITHKKPYSIYNHIKKSQ